MRGKRSKQYKKLMLQYGHVFGFREPYQVLVDAQMIQDTQSFTMDLLSALERVLHGKVKPMITQCSMRHLYLSSLSQAQKDALILRAKSFERRRCNHHTLEQPLPTLECLSSVVDPHNKINKNHYIIASQSNDVRTYFRNIKGVPLIYVKRSVMVMEPMAEASLRAREDFEKGKFRAGIRSSHKGTGIKRKLEGENIEDESDEAHENISPDKAGQLDGTQPKKKTKAWGAKGPNPLSVRKPQKEKENSKADPEVGEQTGPTIVDAEARGVLHDADVDLNIVLPSQDFDSNSTTKRKRKRKHKSNMTEALRTAVQGDGDEGGIPKFRG